MKNLVNYAIAYAEKGLSVLPMLDKKPLITFADKPPLTVDEVKHYWKQFPYAQIAIRTIDIFVIDIDTKAAHGSDGFASLDKFNQEHPGLIIPTLEQETSSGGRQLIYFKRPDMDITQHIQWLPGVDVKAHVNNYFMIAPSERKGKEYKWLNHNPIVTPKPELIEMVNKKPVSKSNYNPGKYEFSDDKTATSELFESIVNGLGETGGRNNALASFVGGLLFRNVEVEVAYELARQANSNTPKALPDKEFNRTFESMVQKEIRRREAIKNIGNKIEK